MAALKYLGPEYVLKASNAELIDRSERKKLMPIYKIRVRDELKDLTEQALLSLHNSGIDAYSFELTGYKELAMYNELYEIKGMFPRTEYFLKYNCPSTNREYVKCVELQEVNGKPSADACQAWSFDVSLEDYLSDGFVEA